MCAPENVIKNKKLDTLYMSSICAICDFRDGLFSIVIKLYVGQDEIELSTAKVFNEFTPKY